MKQQAKLTQQIPAEGSIVPLAQQPQDLPR